MFPFSRPFQTLLLKTRCPEKHGKKIVVLKITCSRNSACSKNDMFELCIYFDVEFIKIQVKRVERRKLVTKQTQNINKSYFGVHKPTM
jgi:hypothetical protein